MSWTNKAQPAQVDLIKYTALDIPIIVGMERLYAGPTAILPDNKTMTLMHGGMTIVHIRIWSYIGYKSWEAGAIFQTYANNMPYYMRKLTHQ